MPKGRKVHRTFAQSATEYLERLEDTIGEGQKGFRDLPNKRRNIERYLVPYFAKHRAARISTFLVQHYTREQLERGAKLDTVNRELATLSHLMRKMVEWKWIKDKDRPEIRKEDEPLKKIVVLKREHIEALYRGAVADQNPWTWLFVLVGFNTAMRHSEILRVRWEDIDCDQRRIYIERAKAGQREQPITAIDTGFLDAITLELHTAGQSPEIEKAKVVRNYSSKTIR